MNDYRVFDRCFVFNGTLFRELLAVKSGACSGTARHSSKDGIVYLFV